MKNRITVDSIRPGVIAPCGMNCSICSGFLRDRKNCLGCNGADTNKPQHCITCKIKNCDELKNSQQNFCFTCSKFPCQRLRNLDKRYRTKYGMSMIENLENIRRNGIEAFVKNEKERWNCPQCGGILSVHRNNCIYCDLERK